jgi:hypothetical protein
MISKPSKKTVFDYYVFIGPLREFPGVFREPAFLLEKLQ